MRTLYKKDSKGKIRQWTISTIDDELCQKSGIVDGKMVEHSKLCKPKNVGKSNQTTGSEQAILEMNSIIREKIYEGYFDTKLEAENELIVLPMLASDYHKFSHKIDWSNCFIQPKLDGMRCIAFIENGTVRLMSRDGKTIENMDHITLALSPVSNCILDGELYIHGSTFQENMKLIKKYVKGETESVQYHVYDMIATDLDFESRKLIVDYFASGIKELSLVSTYPVSDKKNIDHYHKLFLSEGYEGSILRHGTKGYEVDKRSQSLLKLKDFIDIDAEIIDVLPNEANPLHGTPLLRYPSLIHKGFSEFKAGVKMSHNDRIDLLYNKNKYIGKLANIRFFEWTDDGNPRFPVMVGIHLDR